MCLIVAKPKGIPLPKRKQMEQWFNTHPDGFGLAFLHDNKVRILKGAMKFKQVRKLLKKMSHCLGKTNPNDVDIIFHFRQATSGTIQPKNCHPFPITSKKEELESLDVLTDCALAHNGIILDYSLASKQIKLLGQSEKTDTQEFIEGYLVGLGDSLWNPFVQKLIQGYTESRFALLSSRGITYIGDFLEEEGYKYSNGGYKLEKQGYTLPTDDFGYERYGYYGASKSAYLDEEEENVGIACELCQKISPTVYFLPNGNALGCLNCFVGTTGRSPELEDRVY